MGKIILKWFRVNLGIKIFSLLIGILIWWHVRTERIYEATFSIPLCLKNVPAKISFVESPPEFIKIVLRGRGKELMRLKWGHSLEVIYDLSDATTGWRRIDITEENIKLPYWAKVSIIGELSPRSFVMHLKKKK